MTEIGTGIRFSEEQDLLLETASGFCRDKSPVDRVRALMEDERGHDPAVWAEMTALGWLGIALPEEFGGSGLGLGELVTVVEPMGRHLLAGPFIPTCLVARALLSGGSAEQQRTWLPKLSAGTIASPALAEAHGDWDLGNLTCAAVRAGEELRLSGGKTFVLDALAAECLLVSVRLDDAPALLLLETQDLPAGALSRETVVDETRRCYRLKLDGLSAPLGNLLPPERAAACLAELEMAACLLYAAEISGGIAAVLELTIDYLNARRQFDRFIGAYQALKHPTVDILLAYEAARSLLYAAASCFDNDNDNGDAERETLVRMAKAQSSDAFAFAGDRAVQFHGAFGFTYDCDAQLYLRRALWCQSQFGDAPYHRRRLQDLLL